LCVLEWEFSLFNVQEYSRATGFHVATHTHTWDVILAARILRATACQTIHGCQALLHYPAEVRQCVGSTAEGRVVASDHHGVRGFITKRLFRKDETRAYLSKNLLLLLRLTINKPKLKTRVLCIYSLLHLECHFRCILNFVCMVNVVTSIVNLFFCSCAMLRIVACMQTHTYMHIFIVDVVIFIVNIIVLSIVHLLLCIIGYYCAMLCTIVYHSFFPFSFYCVL